MKKFTISTFVLVTGIMIGAFAFAGTAAAQEPVHWSYEGDTGPEHWGELSQDFALCSMGTEQSPIDISSATPINAADIAFNYRPSLLTILNNGHTVQVNYDPGSSIEVEGKSYELLQFHFHASSEHTIDGAPSPLEMHLVHQSDDGSLAVIGVMINRGGENPAFTPVWNNLPAQEAEARTVNGVVIKADDLLPADRTYYRYNGSLTIPPCTEGVSWFVLSTPIEMSDDQAATFEQIYSSNNRPVQSLEARSMVAAPQTEAETQTELEVQTEPETVETAPETLPVTGMGIFPTATILFGLGIAAMGASRFLRRYIY